MIDISYYDKAHLTPNKGVLAPWLFCNVGVWKTRHVIQMRNQTLATASDPPLRTAMSTSKILTA